VRVRDRGAWVQQRYSLGHMMCAQLPLDSQGVVATPRAELITTEAFAARTSCLLCRDSFSYVATVFAHDNDAWVQRRCSAGRMLCAQRPPDSQVWRRWQLRIKHNRGFCCAHKLFALPQLAFVRNCGAYARSRCAGAAALLSGARAVCTAATGFAGVAALVIAEL